MREIQKAAQLFALFTHKGRDRRIAEIMAIADSDHGTNHRFSMNKFVGISSHWKQGPLQDFETRVAVVSFLIRDFELCSTSSALKAEDRKKQESLYFLSFTDCHFILTFLHVLALYQKSILQSDLIAELLNLNAILEGHAQEQFSTSLRDGSLLLQLVDNWKVLPPVQRESAIQEIRRDFEETGTFDFRKVCKLVMQENLVVLVEKATEPKVSNSSVNSKVASKRVTEKKQRNDFDHFSNRAALPKQELQLYVNQLVKFVIPKLRLLKKCSFSKLPVFLVTEAQTEALQSYLPAKLDCKSP